MATKKRVRNASPPNTALPRRETLNALRIDGELSQFDAPGVEHENEIVVIAWEGPGRLRLKGWQVRDEGNRHTYTFGDVTLVAGSKIKLHTGGDPARDSRSDVHWGRRTAVWNNKGDVVNLVDPQGNVLARYAYRGTTRKKKTVAKRKAARATATSAKKKTSARAEKATAAKKKVASKDTRAVAKKKTSVAKMQTSAATKNKSSKAKTTKTTAKKTPAVRRAGKPKESVPKLQPAKKAGRTTRAGTPRDKPAAGGPRRAKRQPPQTASTAEHKNRGALHIDGKLSQFDAPGVEHENEFVVLAWDGPGRLRLQGWQVRDNEARHTYTFGDITLSPGAKIKLHTGGDPAQDSRTDVYWGRRSAVWNNEGDVVQIVDPWGKVQSRYTFQPKTKKEPAPLHPDSWPGQDAEQAAATGELERRFMALLQDIQTHLARLEREVAAAKALAQAQQERYELQQATEVCVAEPIAAQHAEREISVEASQRGVSYQLMVEGRPVGRAVEGNGGTITLPTGPLADHITFVIRAARISHPEIAVELKQRVCVKSELHLSVFPSSR